ncbi:general stress protein 26 [Kineothrix alysoides]|uniref:General stress protein 26 n=1 Tax=Kineothrix alysoides TaxID=1469948 RepID=A0A4R1R6V1_9FIRM|nr:pyridoxamine 5'-phosphate oxidase family protein [Kineothrix alysoides]TCL61199.1 general stress protein 26 [Kineothrix alysoides]
MEKEIKSEICKLRNNACVAYIGSVNDDGFPQIKGMLVLEHSSIKTHYFSTNTSSKRAKQFLNNPKASVYYCDDTMNEYKGALFTGTMEVCTDHDTKAFLWRDGFEIYYPKGIDDEDYCVFKFTAEAVNYYHGLNNTTLSIEEF